MYLDWAAYVGTPFRNSSRLFSQLFCQPFIGAFLFCQNHFQTVYILIHISSSIYFANKNSHFPLITIETLNYFKKNNASQIDSIELLAISYHISVFVSPRLTKQAVLAIKMHERFYPPYSH